MSLSARDEFELGPSLKKQRDQLAFIVDESVGQDSSQIVDLMLVIPFRCQTPFSLYLELSNQLAKILS